MPQDKSYIHTMTQPNIREIKIEKRYLNIPIESSQERQTMTFSSKGSEDRNFVIRLSKEQTDYWVFADMSDYIGQALSITFPEQSKGIQEIYQSDQIKGAEHMYKEKYRPQFHYTCKRGWVNDPNGMVYFDGEFHLYYQHNPYEINWENMHWGHAVSKDLIHWEEEPVALYPDELGTMFSGSAIIDYNNDSGFQQGEEPPMFIAYTADNPDTQRQCIAYSNDRGRTFTKYDGNPVIDSKKKWNSIQLRDPKVFWHEDSKKWIMVLFEKDGHSIYNSDDLKKWEYKSHLGGFWECPELFQLAVDGNMYSKKWVMYGASGTYMIGEFDGHSFTPETDKLNYYSGKMYAAQSFNNIPESDGRRIQVAWGLITHPEMPFRHMITFPTELTLRSTRNGVRLFSEPLGEIEKLHNKSHYWNALEVDEANEKLKLVQGDLFHIKMKVQQKEGTAFRHAKEGIAFQLFKNGNALLTYSFNHNLLNGVFYGGDHIENMTMSLEILLDRTSIEIFADHGRFTIVGQLAEPVNNDGFLFETGRSEVLIHHMEVHELNSIWKNPEN